MLLFRELYNIIDKVVEIICWDMIRPLCITKQTSIKVNILSLIPHYNGASGLSFVYDKIIEEVITILDNLGYEVTANTNPQESQIDSYIISW